MRYLGGKYFVAKHIAEHLNSHECSTYLDPFMGSGTTGVACQAEGVRFVGIERHAPYLRVARARLALG